MSSFLKNENEDDFEWENSNAMKNQFLYVKKMILSIMNLNFIPNENLMKGSTKLTQDINEKMMPFREVVAKAKDYDSLKTALSGVFEELNPFIQKSLNIVGSNCLSPFVKVVQDRVTSFKEPSFLILKYRMMFYHSGKVNQPDITLDEDDVLLKIGKPIYFDDKYEDTKNRVEKIINKYEMPYLMITDLSLGSENLDKLITWVDEQSEDFAKRMGMSNCGVGLKGKIAFAVGAGDKPYTGCYMPSESCILLTEDAQYINSAIAHEWMHAVDCIVKKEASDYMLKKYEVLNKDTERLNVSDSATRFPLDGSPELFKYSKLRRFVMNALSKDFNKLDKEITKKEQEIAESFFKFALKDTYFSLSDRVKKELVSDVGVMLVKKKVNFINDINVAKEIETFTSGILKKNGVSYDKDFFNIFAYSNKSPNNIKKTLKKIQLDFNYIKDFGLAGESEIIKTSRNMDAITGFTNFFITSEKHSDLNTNDKSYYHSNVEVLARYLESQLYYKFVSKVNMFSYSGGEIYAKTKDENFDVFRKDMLSAILGEENVKEMEIPKDENIHDCANEVEKERIKLKGRMNVLVNKAFIKLLGSVSYIYEKHQIKRRGAKEMKEDELYINRFLMEAEYREMSLSSTQTKTVP